MIYELRIYYAVPGQLPALITRFQNRTLQIWERLGIRQAGFWTTLVGESNQQLTYMLAWESFAERDLRWNSFQDDPEWHATVAETESQGPIVQRISNQFLVPTRFSVVQ